MRIFSALKSRFDALRFVFSVGVNDRYGAIQSPWVRNAAETVRQIKRDDVTLLSAGVAYYAILSIFPLTLLLLAILRFFTDAATSRARLEEFFAVYLPDSVDFVDQISRPNTGVSGLLGLVGVLGLLWSGTAMISALTRAVNRAFGIRQDLPFYKDRPKSILLGLGVLTAFGISLFGSAAIEAISNFSVPVLGQQEWVRVFARFLPFSVTFATFALIYKVLPRTRTEWRNVLSVALVGALAFEATKILFLLYLNRLATFEIYGSMALLVVLMVWSYISAFVVLVGAELVAVRQNITTPRT